MKVKWTPKDWREWRRECRSCTGWRPELIVYQATKTQFLKHAFEDDIHEVVGAGYKERTGRRVGPSEFAAWKESLVYMAKVLSDRDIPEDSGVAIEYGIEP